MMAPPPGPGVRAAFAPPPTMAPPVGAGQDHTPAVPDTRAADTAAPKRTSSKRILAIALGAVVVAAGGYFAYTTVLSGSDNEVVPMPQHRTATPRPTSPLSSTPAKPPAPSPAKTPVPAPQPAGSISLPARIGQLQR